MRKLIAVALVLAVGCTSVREGRGVLQPPATAPTTLATTRGSRPFARQPSGSFIRTVFSSDSDPNIRLTVQDISVPPQQPVHPITLAGTALLENLTGGGTITLAGAPVAKAQERVLVPAGIPVSVGNSGDQSVLIRAYLLDGLP
jgi:hypothetical protein